MWTTHHDLVLRWDYLKAAETRALVRRSAPNLSTRKTYLRCSLHTKLTSFGLPFTSAMTRIIWTRNFMTMFCIWLKSSIFNFQSAFRRFLWRCWVFFIWKLWTNTFQTLRRFCVKRKKVFLSWEALATVGKGKTTEYLKFNLVNRRKERRWREKISPKVS